MKTIILTCMACGEKFPRREACYKADMARGRTKICCSRTCLGKSQRVPVAEILCKNCGKIINRLNKDINRSKNHFCSSSCAASYNNKHRIVHRQHKVHKCLDCRLPFIKKKNVVRCDLCIEIWKNRLLNRKKSEVSKRDITTSARAIAMKNGLLNKCKVCGYTLHVDACHRKAINKFSNNTLIREINIATNLIGLCKNHHWEFDHGFLTI